VKIFLIYVLFVTMFITGFALTLHFGLPQSDNYDSLIAFSGMIIGSLCAGVVIFFSERNSNERRNS